jgi:dolichol-phosphate mannosyltransferase
MITIIFPVFNEEKNIPLIYKAAKEELEKLPYAHELIFVNDGSRDGSLALLRELANKDKDVRYINFSRNFGHQAALTAGYEHATGNAIITMDCDLQDPPSLIPQMIAQWEEGDQIVYARRRNRKDNFLKKYTALLYYRLLRSISNYNIPRNVGDFRLIDKKVLTAFLSMEERSKYLRGLFAWLGFKQGFVDFDRPNRLHGKTGYSLSKMLRLSMDGLLNFSFLPLKIGLYVGIFTIFVSLFFLGYFVVDIIINDVYYPLFKWLTVILVGFGGVQFIFLWILGEYLGRIFDDTRRRPTYVVDEKANFDEGPDDQ